MLNGFKKSRLVAGLTQIELAEKLGVSVVSIHNWEIGRNLPKVKRLKHVAEILNTTVEDLLDFDERRTG